MPIEDSDPLEREPSVGIDDRLVTPLSDRSEDTRKGPIRVLHTDDDPTFVELTQDLLEHFQNDITVVTETSARDALERLDADHDVDCVVSDYQMPEMDGLEFLDAVRKQYPELPFILFTSQGSEEIASEAISRGVTDYMQKGTGTDQFDVLANRVRNAVEQHRVQQQLWTTLSWYQQLVEQNLAGVYLLQDGEFVYVNERFAEIFGYSQEELIGTSPDALVASKEHARAAALLNNHQDADSAAKAFAGERKNGEVVRIEAHGGAIEFNGAPATLGMLLRVDRGRDDREATNGE